MKDYLEEAEKLRDKVDPETSDKENSESRKREGLGLARHLGIEEEVKELKEDIRWAFR